MDREELIEDYSIALENGDLPEVKRMTHEDPELIHEYCIGYSMLHYAARGGKLEVVRYLISKGVDVNVNVENGDERNFVSALHESAHEGHFEVSRFLLENGAVVDAGRGTRATPLISAAGKGHIDILELLLQYGADIHATYELGDSMVDAMYLAESYGHEDTTLFLKEKGMCESARTQTASEVLPNDEFKLLVEAENAMKELIGISNDASPQSIVQQIHCFLESYFEGERENNLADHSEMAIGVTIANALVKEYGWIWRRVNQGNWSSIGIVDDQEKWLVLPVKYGADLLEKGLLADDILTPMMLFNCIGEGNLPPSRPMQFTIISGGR